MSKKAKVLGLIGVLGAVIGLGSILLRDMPHDALNAESPPEDYEVVPNVAEAVNSGSANVVGATNQPARWRAPNASDSEDNSEAYLVDVGAALYPESGQERGNTQDEASPTLVPVNWFLQIGGPSNSDPSYELRSDSSVVWDGSVSARLTASQTVDSRAFGTIRQVVSAEDFRERRIRFSAYVRTENVEHGVSIGLRADDINGIVLGFASSPSPPLGGDFGWAQQIIVMDVPENAAVLHLFGAYLAGVGTVWIDDLEIEAVGADFSLTDSQPIASNVRLAPVPSVGVVLDSPQNLSFEETTALDQQLTWSLSSP